MTDRNEWVEVDATILGERGRAYHMEAVDIETGEVVKFYAGQSVVREENGVIQMRYWVAEENNLI